MKANKIWGKKKRMEDAKVDMSTLGQIKIFFTE